MINEDFYFNPQRKLSVVDSNEALRKYANGFAHNIKLEGELPIFVDTNILLGYYGMSQKEKEKLLEFFRNFKERIILTKQVESEFLKNRLSVIKKDFFGPLSKISDDYIKVKQDIEGLLKSFKENKKKILSQDYPELFQKLQEIEEEVKSTINNDSFIEEIKKQVEETTKDHKNIALIDNLLDIVSQFKSTKELSSEEVSFLNEKFSALLTTYSTEKDVIRWKFAIPGCGESKEDAIGDFLIFHEILKYMKENETSCIFLTNDVTKGDWLQIDRNPHNHYIEQAYKLTKEVMFIVHAEKTLNNISFENIHRVKAPTLDNIKEVESTVIRKESTIVSLDLDRGFGFIYMKDNNLYFSYADFKGDFRCLERNDVVQFEIGSNFDGDPKAINVEKIDYSFDNSKFQILTSTITHINKYRGIGFISYQPENLYFHQAFLDEGEDFNLYEAGLEVEFIIGRNDEGEEIARLVRMKKPVQNRLEGSVSKY